MVRLTVAPGVTLWREYFSLVQQQSLLTDVLARLEMAPLYKPVMPKSGTPFSVEESNFGPLGWVSDKTGYRYQPLHPVIGKPWPDIPDALLALWSEIKDRDEKDVTAAVIGVSLGDDALFRIGSATRGGKTTSIALASGDVIAFGGPARLAYHGIDRIKPGTSRLLPGGGRLSLTLRRVAV